MKILCEGIDDTIRIVTIWLVVAHGGGTGLAGVSMLQEGDYPNRQEFRVCAYERRLWTVPKPGKDPQFDNTP